MIRDAPIVDIGDDEPIPLAEAALMFFGGRLSKSSLRTEAAKGNLEIIRIANKDFVTRNGIKRMIERCRVREAQPVSGSGMIPEIGSSRTETSVSAQDALRAKLNGQSKFSANTSRRNTNQSGEVLRLQSR
ncbi:hypothetical protein FHS76_000009 [Ochrobactrum daejeonense]|uniref:Uncharacterized protein n=1 Tax=Brucella daejeonensis TaxID=659015 RepID=A0A7W9EL05_9HYPH|nr:hypothetical protein [Brucella daejeonensis]MBB5700171.1 hypothetical protein [Brucella daejeonensis]